MRLGVRRRIWQTPKRGLTGRSGTLGTMPAAMLR